MSMLLSELIKEASLLLNTKGDLEILTKEGWAVSSIKFQEFEENIKEWNVKKGDKLAILNHDSN